jgi:hypothetical protein
MGVKNSDKNTPETNLVVETQVAPADAKNTLSNTVIKPLSEVDKVRGKGDLADDTSKTLVHSETDVHPGSDVHPEKKEKISQNTEFGKIYLQMKNEIAANPNASNFEKTLLHIIGWLAYMETEWGGAIGELFGMKTFTKKLSETEQFSDKDKEILKKQELVENLKLEGLNDLEDEAASTKFASLSLGISPFTDPISFASCLNNMKRENDEKSYSLDYYETFSKMETFTKGSVMFFRPEVSKKFINVAVATGNGKDFTYFDSATKSQKTFTFGKDTVPGIDMYNFECIFVPSVLPST